MHNETMQEIQTTSGANASRETFEDEFETIADYHRKAAHHFAAAAKFHLAAAQSDEDGDEVAQAMHAYQAYQHQLNAVQYAEIAVMESDALEELDATVDMAG